MRLDDTVPGTAILQFSFSDDSDDAVPGTAILQFSFSDDAVPGTAISQYSHSLNLKRELQNSTPGTE